MAVKISLNSIVEKIAPHNNLYREPGRSNRERLIAMWNIGDILMKAGVTSAHSVGWEVQRVTKGLIKRPTIFRSFKVRSIWPSADQMTRDIGEISGLGNFTEMLPLVDPGQEVRAQLSDTDLRSIYRHSCTDGSMKFRAYIQALKRQYAHGRLGKRLDRNRYLGDLDDVAAIFRAYLTELQKTIAEPDKNSRDQFRSSTHAQELSAFANMCIALTTKDNIRLFKNAGPTEAASKNERFLSLYRTFRSLISKASDVERARLRRVISATELASMSDLVSSLATEESVEDYRERKKISFQL